MGNPSLAKTSILLLVSDQIVHSVMQEILEDEGYTVLAVGDLGNAVKLLQMSAPDHLITRTYVQNLPGHDAAKYLRTKCSKMKVLMVGGLLADDRLSHREAMGGFEVFPTPYPATELLEKVKQVLSAPRG
jgi:DNA-binding NtrC family response regulator